MCVYERWVKPGSPLKQPYVSTLFCHFFAVTADAPLTRTLGYQL